jgi:hypothetical protein
MYREARVCFVRAVRVDEVVFEGEMDLSVELEHGWLTVAVEGDREPRRVSLPTESVGWVLWKGPENYGPTVSRGGI